MRSVLLIATLVSLVVAHNCPPRSREGQTPTPIPSLRQLNWHRDEMQMFFHFGVNTYTNREWGLGDEDPNIFQPVDLNTTQWLATAKAAGFATGILVVKHHDGFWLMPQPDYTNHTVQSSSWHNHTGDVVADFARSANLLDIQISYYVSPWDRNQYNMTWKPSYNKFYEETFVYLLRQKEKYGNVVQLWWDGANAKPNMTGHYDWHRWLEILRKYQPDAVGGGCGGTGGTFDCGPDSSWVFNEGGKGNPTQWLWHAPSVEFPEMGNTSWAGPFCDVSIRPGWFYHPSEDTKLKTLKQLVDIYFSSVGQSCVLQLNVPPNKKGLLCEGDVERVREFGEYIETTFAADAAKNGTASATSTLCGSQASYVVDGRQETYWVAENGVTVATVEVELAQALTVNTVMMQEHIPDGQFVSRYAVDVRVAGEWRMRVTHGTTIGYKKLDRFEEDLLVEAVRLTIEETFGGNSAEIERLGLFYAKPL